MIEEFFAMDETIEYYRQNEQKAAHIVEEVVVPICLEDEAARRVALTLACAIIALAG